MIAPFLGAPQIFKAIDAVLESRGSHYINEKRDDTLASISQRLSKLGRLEDAQWISTEIRSHAKQFATRLRIAESTSPADRSKIIEEAMTMCRSTMDYAERVEVNQGFLQLDAESFKRANLIELFTLSMENASLESRRSAYETVQLFLPSLYERVDREVAPAIFTEIVKTREWWHSFP